MRRYISVPLLLTLAVLVSVSSSFGLDVGSDGSDGVFSPSTSVTIDLGQAATATWSTPSPVPGKGVYDGEKWAVVFKYSAVNIPAGVTVTFTNHPSRAPVVWLVQGDVTISGRVSVDGGPGSNPCSAIPESGPGGWRAGKARYTSGFPDSGPGRGPGGGNPNYGRTPSYGTVGEGYPSPTYGNPQILPLVGGSGGGGGDSCGGGAGGAILIASNGSIALHGQISAVGGNSQDWYGGGSGGAVRLVADSVTGSGLLRAAGASGNGESGAGRIRVDATTISLTDPGIPLYTAGLPGNPARIWPSESAPKVRAVRLGGKPVPADPYSSLNNQDVRLSSPNPVLLEIEAQNVPLSWIVDVRVVAVAGNESTTQATLLSGDQTLSQWTASLNLPPDISTIQVRAHKP